MKSGLYKGLSFLFTLIGLLISHAMCAVLAYSYRDMLCGIAHSGYSYPVNVVFLYAIPFVAGILVCAGMAMTFHRKARRIQREAQAAQHAAQQAAQQSAQHAAQQAVQQPAQHTDQQSDQHTEV